MSDKRFYWQVRPIADEKNIIKGKKYRFTVLTPSLIRMEYQKSGEFEDRASQSVFFRDFPENKYEVTMQNGEIIVKTSELCLVYKENEPFNADTLYIKLLNEPASQWNYGDDFEDLGGTTRTLDAVNGATKLKRGVCSRFGFSVLDDTDNMVLNPDDGWVEMRHKNATDCYFFGYGYRYIDAVKDYYRLTGIPPLLPAYALGNWWSRYYKYTQEEYLALMDRFLKENYPFSVGVIDMDWHITSLPDELVDSLAKEYKKMDTGWTGYTWNEEYFPDYKTMLSQLHEKNLKIALNLHPAQGVRKHEAQFEKMALEMGLDPEKENIVPFDILSQKYMEKYFDILHHPYEDDGVDFWWMDYQQGLDYWWIHKINEENAVRDEREKLDPLWMLNHLHILDISRNGKRPMFFSRFCGAGSQRYPVGFSGDTYISWDSLKFQPYFTATASNIGYSWWSHDIGGHLSGYFDEELMIRWLQFGVFSPINRLHSSNQEFIQKEPWSFDEHYSKIMNKWLNLRHDLFPYIYTMNYRNHNDLLPLIQPMYYAYPKCNDAYNVPNQYWFGSEFFVAPITELSSQTDKLGSVTAWLPKGDWFDLFNGTHYHSESGRMIELFRSIEDCPVLAKAGAIVPTAIRNESENRLMNFDKMRVTVFPGASNSFTLYEDKGDGFEYKNGEYATTLMHLEWKENPEFCIEPAKNDISLIPEKRNWVIEFRSFNKDIELSVTVNGSPVKATISKDENTHTHTVSLQAKTTDRIVITIFGKELIHDNYDAFEHCRLILQHSKIGYNRKEEIMNYLQKKEFWLSVYQRIDRLCAFSPEAAHTAKALKEQLFALTEN